MARCSLSGQSGPRFSVRSCRRLTQTGRRARLRSLAPKVEPYRIGAGTQTFQGWSARQRGHHHGSCIRTIGRRGAPIYGIKVPQEHRDWHLISVSRLAVGKSDNSAAFEGHMAHNQLRTLLGNEIATKAFREGQLRSCE